MTPRSWEALHRSTGCGLTSEYWRSISLRRSYIRGEQPFYAVYLGAEILTPNTQKGRKVYIELNPDEADALAESLTRYAAQARKLADEQG